VVGVAAITALVLPAAAAWAQQAPPPAPATPAPAAPRELSAWIEAVQGLDAIDYRVKHSRYTLGGQREDVGEVTALVETAVAEGVSYAALCQRLERWYEGELADGRSYVSINSGGSSRFLRVRARSYLQEDAAGESIETPAVSAQLRDVSGMQSVAHVLWNGRTNPQRCPVFGPHDLLAFTGLDLLTPWARTEFMGVGGDAQFREAIQAAKPSFVIDWTKQQTVPTKNRMDLWQVTYERGHPYAPVAVLRRRGPAGEWSRLDRRWFVPSREAAPLPRFRVGIDSRLQHDGSVNIRVDVMSLSDFVVHDPKTVPPLRIQLPADCRIQERGVGWGYASMPAGWYRHWAEVLEPPPEQAAKLVALRATPLVAPPPPKAMPGPAPKGPYLTRLLIALDAMWPWWAGVIAIVASCVVLSADPDRRPLRRTRPAQPVPATDATDDEPEMANAG
jgi:hypothetical protein